MQRFCELDEAVKNAAEWTYIDIPNDAAMYVVIHERFDIADWIRARYFKYPRDKYGHDRLRIFTGVDDLTIVFLHVCGMGKFAAAKWILEAFPPRDTITTEDFLAHIIDKIATNENRIKGAPILSNYPRRHSITTPSIISVTDLLAGMPCMRTPAVLDRAFQKLEDVGMTPLNKLLDAEPSLTSRVDYVHMFWISIRANVISMHPDNASDPTRIIETKPYVRIALKEMSVDEVLLKLQSIGVKTFAADGRHTSGASLLQMDRNIMLGIWPALSGRI